MDNRVRRRTRGAHDPRAAEDVDKGMESKSTHISNSSSTPSNRLETLDTASSISMSQHLSTSEIQEQGTQQESDSSDGYEAADCQTEEEAKKELRSSWQFACTVQFTRIFAKPLELRSFSCDILERAILRPAEKQNFLAELVFKLVRPDANAPFLERDALDGWEALLAAKMRARWREAGVFTRNPLRRRGFLQLTSVQRLHVLYALCEWRAEDCPVVREAIRFLSEDPDTLPEALREAPLGCDAGGNRYYCFSHGGEDCYLFRETPPATSGRQQRGGGSGSGAAGAAAGRTTRARNRDQPTSAASNPATATPATSNPAASNPATSGPTEGCGWATQCVTLEELRTFAGGLRPGRGAAERQLKEALQEQLLPKLAATEDARRRAEHRAARRETGPQKRSDRLQVLHQRKEEEDAAKKARVEEERHQREEETRERERKRKEQEREQQLRELEEARRRFLGLQPPSGPLREERMRMRLERKGSEEPVARSTSRESNQETPSQPPPPSSSTKATNTAQEFPNQPTTATTATAATTATDQPLARTRAQTRLQHQQHAHPNTNSNTNATKPQSSQPPAAPLPAPSSPSPSGQSAAPIDAQHPNQQLPPPQPPQEAARTNRRTRASTSTSVPKTSHQPPQPPISNESKRSTPPDVAAPATGGAVAAPVATACSPPRKRTRGSTAARATEATAPQPPVAPVARSRLPARNPPATDKMQQQQQGLQEEGKEEEQQNQSQKPYDQTGDHEAGGLPEAAGRGADVTKHHPDPNLHHAAAAAAVSGGPAAAPGSLLSHKRQRGRGSRRGAGRHEHDPGWSPLGEVVVRGARAEGRRRPRAGQDLLLQVAAGNTADLPYYVAAAARRMAEQDRRAALRQRHSLYGPSPFDDQYGEYYSRGPAAVDDDDDDDAGSPARRHQRWDPSDSVPHDDATDYGNEFGGDGDPNDIEWQLYDEQYGPRHYEGQVRQRRRPQQQQQRRGQRRAQGQERCGVGKEQWEPTHLHLHPQPRYPQHRHQRHQHQQQDVEHQEMEVRCFEPPLGEEEYDKNVCDTRAVTLTRRGMALPGRSVTRVTAAAPAITTTVSTIYLAAATAGSGLGAGGVGGVGGMALPASAAPLASSQPSSLPSPHSSSQPSTTAFSSGHILPAPSQTLPPVGAGGDIPSSLVPYFVVLRREGSSQQEQIATSSQQQQQPPPQPPQGKGALLVNAGSVPSAPAVTMAAAVAAGMVSGGGGDDGGGLATLATAAGLAAAEEVQLRPKDCQLTTASTLAPEKEGGTTLGPVLDPAHACPRQDATASERSNHATAEVAHEVRPSGSGEGTGTAASPGMVTARAAAAAGEEGTAAGAGGSCGVQCTASQPRKDASAPTAEASVVSPAKDAAGGCVDAAAVAAAAVVEQVHAAARAQAAAAAAAAQAAQAAQAAAAAHYARLQAQVTAQLQLAAVQSAATATAAVVSQQTVQLGSAPAAPHANAPGAASGAGANASSGTAQTMSAVPYGMYGGGLAALYLQHLLLQQQLLMQQQQQALMHQNSTQQQQQQQQQRVREPAQLATDPSACSASSAAPVVAPSGPIRTESADA